MADKIVKDLEIKNIKGLHARAAAAFVKAMHRQRRCSRHWPYGQGRL